MSFLSGLDRSTSPSRGGRDDDRYSTFSRGSSHAFGVQDEDRYSTSSRRSRHAFSIDTVATSVSSSSRPSLSRSRRRQLSRERRAQVPGQRQEESHLHTPGEFESLSYSVAQDSPISSRGRRLPGYYQSLDYSSHSTVPRASSATRSEPEPFAQPPDPAFQLPTFDAYRPFRLENYQLLAPSVTSLGPLDQSLGSIRSRDATYMGSWIDYHVQRPSYVPPTYSGMMQPSLMDRSTSPPEYSGIYDPHGSPTLPSSRPLGEFDFNDLHLSEDTPIIQQYGMQNIRPGHGRSAPQSSKERRREGPPQNNASSVAPGFSQDLGLDESLEPQDRLVSVRQATDNPRPTREGDKRDAKSSPLKGKASSAQTTSKPAHDSFKMQSSQQSMEMHSLQQPVKMHDQLPDLDALTHTEEYFALFDNVEEAVNALCSGALQALDAGNMHEAFEGIDEAWHVLLRNGCMSDSLPVLLQDRDRSAVVKVLNLSVPAVQTVFQHVASSRYTAAGADVELLFGGLKMSLHTSSRKESLRIFAKFLVCATLAIAGSYTSELEFNRVTSFPKLCIGSRKVWFYRQALACLDDYVGAPVWTFGYTTKQDAAWLSASIQQFADLWGPLFAIPVVDEKHKLYALQTEGGLLYKAGSIPQPLLEAPATADGEILMHWSAIHSIHRISSATSSPQGPAAFAITVQGRQEPSFRFEPFDASATLLIGQPTAPTMDKSMCPALVENIKCQFDAQTFAGHHCNRFHFCGTSEAYYEPAEFQLGFQAGQYIIPTANKVWKNRAGTTYKKRLLFCLESANAETVKNLMQRQIGFQMSACTWHSRRISLERVLTLAFPSEATSISNASSTGETAKIIPLISDLALSGFDTAGNFQLYWTSGRSNEVFDLKKDRPRWTDMLKDTRDSACFAVLTPDCLLPIDPGTMKQSKCSNGVEPGKALATLQTSLGLNKVIHDQLTMHHNTEIRLTCGNLKLAGKVNGKTSSTAVFTSPQSRIFVYAVYEKAVLKFNIRRTAEEKYAHELMDPDRPTTQVLAVNIVDA